MNDPSSHFLEYVTKLYNEMPKSLRLDNYSDIIPKLQTYSLKKNSTLSNYPKKVVCVVKYKSKKGLLLVLQNKNKHYALPISSCCSPNIFIYRICHTIFRIKAMFVRSAFQCLI